MRSDADTHASLTREAIFPHPVAIELRRASNAPESGQRVKGYLLALERGLTHLCCIGAAALTEEGTVPRRAAELFETKWTGPMTFGKWSQLLLELDALCRSRGTELCGVDLRTPVKVAGFAELVRAHPDLSFQGEATLARVLEYLVRVRNREAHSLRPGVSEREEAVRRAVFDVLAKLTGLLSWELLYVWGSSNQQGRWTAKAELLVGSDSTGPRRDRPLTEPLEEGLYVRETATDRWVRLEPFAFREERILHYFDGVKDRGKPAFTSTCEPSTIPVHRKSALVSRLTGEPEPAPVTERMRANPAIAEPPPPSLDAPVSPPPAAPHSDPRLSSATATWTESTRSLHAHISTPSVKAAAATGSCPHPCFAGADCTDPDKPTEYATCTSGVRCVEGRAGRSRLDTESEWAFHLSWIGVRGFEETCGEAFWDRACFRFHGKSGFACIDRLDACARTAGSLESIPVRVSDLTRHGFDIEIRSKNSVVASARVTPVGKPLLREALCKGVHRPLSGDTSRPLRLTALGFFLKPAR